MIKIKMSTMNDTMFTRTLKKIATCNKINVKVAYNAGKINQKVEQTLEEARIHFQKILKNYAEKNEASEVKFDEKGMFTIPEASQPAFNGEYAKMLGEAVEMPFSRLELNSLSGAELSGVELMAIEPILLSLEVLEGGGGQVDESPIVVA